MEAGAIDPDDPAHLQPLCHPCHSRKTATEDRRWREANDPLDLLTLPAASDTDPQGVNH